MTTIDERGRAAARALRDAIAAHPNDVPVHEIEVEPPKRRRSSQLLVAAAVIVLLGLVVSVVAISRGGDVDHVAARSYLARTIAVPRNARQVVALPNGALWVLGGCTVPPSTCNELHRVDITHGPTRQLPSGVDRALTYASGSLWAAGAGDGAGPTGTGTGTVIRLGATSGRLEHRYDFPGVTPTDVVGAYGNVWVLDAQHARVVRINPATNATKIFPLQTRALGRVGPQQMLVADGTIVLSTRCCGADPQFAQIGRINRDGTYTTFFSTMGHVAVATDGTNLWVNTPTGPTHKFAISRANKDAVSWYSLLDEDYRMQTGLKFATRGSVWSVNAPAGTVQRLDRTHHRLEQAFTLPRGGFADSELDVAQSTTRAWVLDGTHGALYELRDPK
jgi:hypothetical protein